jgi:16S rRNA (guanine(966)-N(2))-methyltransferase RsmD
MNVRVSGGKHRGRRIRAGKGSGLRPTSEKVRLAIFSILGADLEGKRVLDAYAGTGSLGIEALSRGARWADFVETDGHRCEAIRETLKDLDMQQARVHKGKIGSSLSRLGHRYDVVFADPPYDEDPWDVLLSVFGSGKLLNIGARVVAEHSSKIRLQDSYGSLMSETRRRYGDSAVTFYRLVKNNG